jgi:hypothetical protein
VIVRKRFVRWAVAAAVLAAVIALQYFTRAIYLRTHPHGWYVVVEYSQRSAVESFQWGTKHNSKTACLHDEKRAAKEIAFASMTCTELSDEEARRLSAVPPVLLQYGAGGGAR